MTFRQLEQTCTAAGWEVTAEKKDGEAVFHLKRTFAASTPPLTLTLRGRTCRELTDHLRRTAEAFDTDRETYRHLDADGHGTAGFPQHIPEVARAVRRHKDELDRLVNECSDALLPAGTRTMPAYEFRRRTKEMLGRCMAGADRLIDRTLAESGIDLSDTQDANLLPVSATRAILRWMGENFRPPFPVPYGKEQAVRENEKRIHDSL